MKKILLLMMTVTFLSGCGLLADKENGNAATSQNPAIETTQVSVVETANPDESAAMTEAEQALLEESRSLAMEKQEGSLFNETVVGDSVYPASTIPDNILADELMQGINDYYRETFSETDKSAGTPRVPDLVLQSIEDIINKEEDLSSLTIAVDQISMQLDDQTIYVPRVIVPMSYSEAEAIASDNDTRLFNHALTEVGNRLVMIAYYDSESDTLTPMHLMNLTNSLFYLEP